MLMSSGREIFARDERGSVFTGRRIHRERMTGALIQVAVILATDENPVEGFDTSETSYTFRRNPENPQETPRIQAESHRNPRIPMILTPQNP